MKKIIYILIIVVVFLGKEASSQNIFIGKNVSVAGTATLYVSGNFTTDSVADYINDATVEIKGNISNDKELMRQGDGLTKLTGSTSQTIAGLQPFIVNNVTINNTSLGSGNITLVKNLIVGKSATFTDGLIKTGVNKIIFKDSATYATSSDSSHVFGLVEKIGNQAFVFPVGDSIKLRTAEIAAPSLATDTFTCEYFRLVPTVGTIGLGINNVSTAEYWVIEKTAGSTNPLVTLSYCESYSGVINAVADLRVANLISGEWTDMGGTGIGAPSGVVAATAASLTWGAFTLGSSTSNNPLPIKLLSFNAVYNATNSNVDLVWETISEVNSAYFTVERSKNGINWNEIIKHEAAGNSENVLNYTTIDENPNNGINYYRLKETDFNGDYFYSTIKFVTINPNVSTFSIYPNPIISNATVNYYVNNDEEVRFEITNAIGQVLLNKTITLKEGENKISLEMEQFNAGNYFFKIQSLDTSKIETRKLIKLN